VSTSTLFTLLAIICFLTAAILGIVYKSWVAAAFCAGVTCLVIAGVGVNITD
jgi:hypothetical protein